MSRHRAGTAPAGAVASDEILRVENLTLQLGDRRILDEVNFAIAEGEFAGLIGSNGAGKTTLLKVILGLMPSSFGRVLVDGGSRSRRGSLIGYVPQKIEFDPEVPLRARDLIGLGLDGHRYGIPIRTAERNQRIDEMVAAVDATEFAEARVGNLSGGEQQRVMIAHALISQPKLLLLDEPLANLDLRSGNEVVRLLARIASEHGVTILLSAHDMNPLLPVIDRIVYMAAGRAATGTTEQVICTETLSELYRHPVEVIRVGARVLVVSGEENPIVEREAADALVGFGAH